MKGVNWSNWKITLSQTHNRKIINPIGTQIVEKMSQILDGKWNNYQLHGQRTKRQKKCFKREWWVGKSNDKTIGICLVQWTKKSLKLGLTFALQKYAFCYHKAFPNLKSLHRNLLGVQHMMIQILGLAKMPNAHNGTCKNARRSWFHKMRQKIWSKYLNVYQVAKGSQ